MLDHVIVFIAATKIGSSKVVIRAFVDGVHSPVDPGHVDMHMAAVGCLSAKGVLEIGNELIADILAEHSLAVAGVVPDVVEASVNHEGIEAVGCLVPERNPGLVEDLVAEIPIGELNAHGKVIALPAAR